MIALALITWFGSAGIFFSIPHLAVRMTLWGIIHSVYRIEVLHRERVPKRGGAILVANHVSFADPFLVGGSIQRYVRYLIHRDLMEVPLVGFFARMMRAIPVASTDSPREMLKSLEKAGEAASTGELTCIFAEGGISRTGNLLPFSRGLERVARRAGVPIVPIYLGRVWGSIFSFQGGKFFYKRPLKLPYPVTVAIGEPLPPDASAYQVRRAVQELSAEALDARKCTGNTLATEFLAMARRRGGHPAAIEHGKPPVSYRRLLTGALLLRKLLRERLSGEEYVGVLLPAGIGGALVNVALALLGKTVVNLNFTAGKDALRAAAERTELRTVITAAVFLDKLGMDLGAVLPAVARIELPDLLSSATTAQKLRAAIAARAPSSILRRLPDVPQDPDAVATVVFSSGSTGEPKGVMLTHHNILSNVRSMSQVFDPRRDDRVVGILPFFHSFGYSVTIWFPFLDGMTAIYHPNPMDTKVIADLVREHRGTIFLATPTFYRTYYRRFEPADFASVRLAVSGAEKLKTSLARDWEERFGRPILEGYGCTELSPVVSVNLPDVVRPGVRQRASKLGSIGQPLPGIVPKVVDPETFAELPLGTEGLLLIKGPNVMKGYLGQEKETAEVIRDGWYVTGDIAKLDEEGFITITDRLSRFSKLGGEMVPHMLIEEHLQEAVDELAHSEEGEEKPQVAITSIPDEAKGERLAVVHTPLPIPIDTLLVKLHESDLPNLWIPRRDSFVEVETIPRLGSGKLDLRAVRAIALERLPVRGK
jgi:acyl-[acyl-carrier-protein]-phospholipid O-acyltransferase/long-chain-fatty-acid--[acyl-carrier-protein] ligase